jgi:hypothetical protein
LFKVQVLSQQVEPVQKYGSVLKDCSQIKDTTTHSNYADVSSKLSQMLFNSIKELKPDL